MNDRHPAGAPRSGTAGEAGARSLSLEILPQPDDVTCGPTCLHAVYRYHGDVLPLDRVIREVTPLATGGTLAVALANHALSRGYGARIYTWNLAVFDPTWFRRPGIDLAERLRAQLELKSDARLRHATVQYLEFLAAGGELRHAPLTLDLIRHWLDRDRPLLTGLSATYLYDSMREVGETRLVEDDLRGEPQGHFVVLCGIDPAGARVRVADPLHDNPGFREHLYWAPADRLIGALFLGALTYDANFLVLEPPGEKRA